MHSARTMRPAPPLHYQKGPYIGMGTRCNPQKGPLWMGMGLPPKPTFIWAWGHLALPKGPLKVGMGTLCTAKRPPKYGDGDNSRCQIAP